MGKTRRASLTVIFLAWGTKRKETESGLGKERKLILRILYCWWLVWFNIISKHKISFTMYRRGWLDREIYENGFKCYWILKTIGYHLISLDWIEYTQAGLDCDQKWGSTLRSWRYINCPVMCAYDCARSFQMIVSHLIQTYWSPMLPIWGTGRAWLSIGAPNASSSLSLFASWAMW